MKGVRFGSVVVPPVVFATSVLLVVLFVVVGLAVRFAPAAAELVGFLPVTTSGVLSGQVWRLLSYAFIHDLANTFHLIFNVLFLVMFGRDLEARWGSGRMALFLVLTVFMGGVFVVAAGALGLGGGAAVGASAAAEGCIVAWGLLNRDMPVRFMFAIPMKGIHFVWLAVGLGVLEAVSQSSTSAAAHFGGMAMAAFLVLFGFNRNKRRLVSEKVLTTLRLKKQPRLTVVPKGPDRWVN